MAFSISVWEGDKHAGHGVEDTLDKAKEAALAFSRRDRGVTYTIHERGKALYRARDGKLLDADGNPLK
jgi:hypothetical protein